MPRTITPETENLIEQANLLRDAGWTIRKIANELGVSHQTIQNWLINRQPIDRQANESLSTYNYDLPDESRNSFYHGDCLFVMNHDIPPGSIDLIYLDPPFFTGKIQKGEVWRPEAMEVSYEDSKQFWKAKGLASHAPEWMKHIALQRPDFAAYLHYMMERLYACHNVLKETGGIYLHCDWRASHYLKMAMDEIFNSANLRNEIIWFYNSGARGKLDFGRRHETIFRYSKTDNYIFNIDNIALREPYSPNINIPKSKEHYYDPNGKVIGDVWQLPILAQNDKTERIGYPTQKPLKLLERIILASSSEGDIVLDPFCGCGTAIIASLKLNRRWIGIDVNSTAYDITKNRAGEAEETIEKQLPLGQIQDFAKAQYICRDLPSVKSMNPHILELWVNQFYGAMKPSPDKGVDGITREGIPIQSKTFIIKYATISQFLTDARYHDYTKKPIKKLIIVSQKGFDDSARKRKYEIENQEKIEVILATPESMLINPNGILFNNTPPSPPGSGPDRIGRE